MGSCIDAGLQVRRFAGTIDFIMLTTFSSEMLSLGFKRNGREVHLTLVSAASLRLGYPRHVGGRRSRYGN